MTASAPMAIILFLNLRFIAMLMRFEKGSNALTEVNQQKLCSLFFIQSTDRIVLPVTICSPADVYTALSVSYEGTVLSARGEMI